MPADIASAIVDGLQAPGIDSSDDDEQGLSASQLMGAEELIRAINPPYDSGPARPSRVARAVETIVRSTMRKIEADDD